MPPVVLRCSISLDPAATVANVVRVNPWIEAMSALDKALTGARHYTG